MTSSDVKNRVDSLLGPRGLFSWRALSSDYKSISPGQAEVSRLFASLESLLNTKKILPFKQLTAQLTANMQFFYSYVFSANNLPIRHVWS